MRKEFTEITKEAAQGSYHLFLGNTVSTFILAITSMIVARLLGPEEYGVYSLTLVVPELVVGLINFGMTSALTHFSAKLRAEGKKQELTKVIETCLLFGFLVSSIASVMCFFFSGILSKYLVGRSELNFHVRLASIIILLQTVFNMLASMFIGLNLMEINARMLVVSSLIKNILSPILILIGFGVPGAIYGQLFYYATTIAIGLVYVGKYKILKLHWMVELKTLRKVFTYSLPIYVSSLIALISLQYQSLILAYFTSNIEVGNFQITKLFASAILLLVFPFTSLFPSFTKIRSNLKELQRIFSISVKYTAILVIPASLVIATMSKDLIFTFFGSDFNLAPAFLTLYILTNIYAGLGSSVILFLLSGIGKTRAILKLDLVNFLVFFPLAPLLAHLFGGLGLIFAIITARTAWSIYGLLIATKEIGVHPDLKSSMKIYLSSILAVIPIIIFLRISAFRGVFNLLVSGLIFCFCYLTLLPSLGVITKTDIDALKSIFSENKIFSFILKLILNFETMIINRVN